MLLLSFNTPPSSSPITQNPVRFAILYRVTKHYGKRHGFTPPRKKTALFGVLFKFPHRVQMWCAETWILWRRWKLLLIFMTNGRWLRISKKNQKHCVWEWRNKTKNFQYWKKKKVLKITQQNLILKHGRNWTCMWILLIFKHCEKLKF